MLNDRHITKVTDLIPLLQPLKNVCRGTKSSRKKRASWIKEHLERFGYRKLVKKEKGVLHKYLCVMTGCNERTINRHIEAYKKGKKICHSYERNKFSSIYTNKDRELLAETDNCHGRLNGKATKKILQTEYIAGDKRFKVLSQISCAHIYNLRKTHRYREVVQVQGKTQSIQSSIGERKKPRPEGKPGYIRIDTVHQGDHEDGTKGLYHINLVDEITQYQIVFAVENISELFLIPLLELALTSYPFAVKNFHSDNGSEFINKVIASLLNKLLIEQTKSRARKSNDNGLVESKNGSTVRKLLGHWHIPKKFVAPLNRLYQDYFVPYLNYHRPCAFPVKQEESNGKIKILYPEDNYMTPLQKLLSIENVEQYFKQGITKKYLQELSQQKTPNQAGKELQEERKKFLQIALQKN